MQRMRNIEENKGKLLALGLEKNPLEIERATPRTVKGASVNRRPKPERPPVRQRSLRVQNLGTDGEPLPDRDVKPPTPAPEDLRPVRKPPAPLDAAKVSTGATSAEEAAAFLARLSDDKHTPRLLSGADGDGTTAPKANTRDPNPNSNPNPSPSPSPNPNPNPAPSPSLISGRNPNPNRDLNSNPSPNPNPNPNPSPSPSPNPHPNPSPNP